MTERSHSGYGEHGNNRMYFREKREQRQTKIGNMGASLLSVSYSFEPGPARHFDGLDLGSNCYNSRLLKFSVTWKELTFSHQPQPLSSAPLACL